MDDVLALGEVAQTHPPGIQPLLPGMHPGQSGLDLAVADDPPLRRVDEEHAAGAQAPPPLDALGRDVQHAGLTADDDETVGRLGPPAGAQAVAIQRGADERPVGEDQGGGPVPRLHLHRVVLVERAQRRVDLGLLLVRLRHHHHDRVRQAASREGEQLQHLVERRRVARPRRADRQQRCEVAEQLRLELGLTGAHPVPVAVDRVDLTVVRQHPQRLGERPRRERVRRVAGVDDGELGCEPLVLQVRIERLELKRRDHALVAERAAGQRDEVGVELVAGAHAQAVGPPIQRDPRQRGRDIRRGMRDEQLLEHGPGFEGELPQVRIDCRHAAPAEHGQPLAHGDALDAVLLRAARFVVAREEQHSGGVFPHDR